MKKLSILHQIRNIQIQGAEDIARYSLLYLKNKASKSNALTKTRFLEELEKAKLELLKLRPTEPCMQNSIKFAMHNLSGENIYGLRNDFITRAGYALEHLELAEKRIAEIGSRKIVDGMNIFTHCHSSTVMNILKLAKEQGKKIKVHCTETRPLFQGRKTAIELSNLGIEVTHYIDSAARIALRRSDIMLIGADAITSEGKIINKIGSELFAIAANKFEIPLYVCSDSWKFDAKTVFGFDENLEKRKPQEVWPKAPKHIKINNFAFEKVDANLISGIISELGVYKPEVFVEEIKRKYRFMFS